MVRFDRPSPHGSAGPTNTAEEVPGGCRRAGEQGRRRDEAAARRVSRREGGQEAEEAAKASRCCRRAIGEAGHYADGEVRERAEAVFRKATTLSVLKR